MGSKCKEVTTGDEEWQQLSKKAREKQLGKYCRGATVKMGGTNPCERCMSTRQDCLVYLSRWIIFIYTYYFFNNFLFHSGFLTYTRCITLKQWYVPHTNTNTPAMISTYGGVLSAIKKVLQELIEEYWGVGKSLWDLVEGQERNTVMNLFLRVRNKNNFCIRETQENSIEIPLQSSLPYILLPMVCAHYCAPYPKQPCVEHEANMYYLCYMTLLYSRIFYFLLLSPVICLVTMPSSCDWCDSVTNQP